MALGFVLYIPGVAVVLNYNSSGVDLVSLHTGAQSLWHTLALLVLHKPCWALAARNTHSVTISSTSAVITALSVWQIGAGPTAHVTALLVHLTPRALDRWVGKQRQRRYCSFKRGSLNVKLRN